MPDQPNIPDDPIGSDLVRGDPSLADLVMEFVDGLGTRIEAMETALQESNLDALRAAAHQLKGSGGGYGYPLLTHRAGELERVATENLRDECTHALDELKQVCKRVVVSDDQ